MSFYYLASPYTHESLEVMEGRYAAALHCLQWLIKRRIWVYSPIVHCHHVAINYVMPKDNDFWKEYNREMLDEASGLIILKIDGTAISVGVQDEIKYFEKSAKRVNIIVPVSENEYMMEVHRRSL